MNNSLAEVHPELVSEWSEKNLTLTPDDITFGSNKKVWWRGACGHEWQARVAYLNGSKAVEAPPVELIQFVNNEVKKVPSDLFTTSILEVCFYTDDIDSAYKHLVDNNVECLSEPQYFDFRADGFGESRAFYFRDPDGIILEMMQPL